MTILHGFSNVENYKLKDVYNDDVSEIGIGYHNVTYNNELLTVLAVTIRGTNGIIEEWGSNIDIGNPDSWNSEYHKGFYTTEQRIMEYVKDYLSANKKGMDSNVVFWVSGHSRGAALANLLAADLIEKLRQVLLYLT